MSKQIVPVNKQIVSCPHCGRDLMIVPPSLVVGVRSLDGRGRSSATFWSASREVARSLLPSSTSFEHEATSFFPSAQPSRESGDQNLAPGELHTSKMYRERSMTDVKIPLIANLVSSGMVSAITLTGSLLTLSTKLITSPIWLRQCQWWFGHRWYAVTPAAFLATMAYLWFRRQLPDLLDDDKLISAVQEHERRPEPAPIEIKPPSVEVIVPQGKSKGYQDKRATLTAPTADHSGLWRYCRALALKEAFPSWEGGKSGPGGKAFGFTEVELVDFRERCAKAGLMVEPKKTNQPWTITPDGVRAFHEIAHSKEANYAIN